MPTIGLNPFDHPVDFNELRLPDLVSFFTYISEELSRLRAMVGAELDKEGLQAAVDRERALQAVAPCITNVVRLEKQRDFGGV